MHIRSVFAVAVLAAGLAVLGPPAQAADPAQQHARIATDIVEYRCTSAGVAEQQTLKVHVALRMPTDATTGQQMTIGWQGSYADGTGLRAPTAGLATGTKLYAYAAISGITALSSATGVGTLDPVGGGQIIGLPATEIALKTTASHPGTATVKPAAMNFGTRPTEPSIECEPQNAADLTSYPLTVAAAGQTTTATPTTSATPTRTATSTVTPTTPDEKVTKTPAGAADTGGGGEQGPDGRMLVLAGCLLTLAAIAGLLRRRRTSPRR